MTIAEAATVSQTPLQAAGRPVTQLDHTDVAELMRAEMASQPVVLVSPQNTLREAAELMFTHRTDHLVVVANGTQEPLGIISALDILAALAADAEDPDADDPDAEDPDADDPDAEDPDAEDPDAEDPDAEDPDAEDPRALVELTREECVRLLSTHRLGRLVISLPGRPAVVRPVDYTFASGSIFVRTAPGTKLHALLRATAATFEIDELGPHGWSVIVQGRPELVEQPPDLRRLALSGHRSTAPGRRDTWVRIRARTISGRRITVGHDVEGEE